MPRQPAEPLTPNEVHALVAACSRRAPTGVRNRALVVLLWRSGLRVSEALALRPKDVDLVAGTVRVLRGKGDRSRVVSFDPGAGVVLEGWLERRRKVLPLASVPSGGWPVFCTLAGRRLQPSYVRQLLPRLARRAGVAKRVHPHGLRHTYALELAGEGVPLHKIARLLGHANVATTSRYLARLGDPEVLAVARERPAWFDDARAPHRRRPTPTPAPAEPTTRSAVPYGATLSFGPSPRAEHTRRNGTRAPARR